MPTHTFTTPDPVTLAVQNGAGSVSVETRETTETVVEVTGKHADDVRVTQDGDTITVAPPRLRGGLLGDQKIFIAVTAPTGSRPDVKTGSADIALLGTLGTTAVRSGSGDVSVAEATDTVLVETGSGDVRVDTARGEARVKSGSGDLSVGTLDAPLTVSTGSGDVVVGSAAAPVAVKTGSGDLRVDTSTADVTFRTGSGDLTLGNAHRGRIESKGASGDVEIAVPAGTPVWTDISCVSGRVRSELDSVGAPAEGADHVEAAITTVSGDVRLHHS